MMRSVARQVCEQLVSSKALQNNNKKITKYPVTAASSSVHVKTENVSFACRTNEQNRYDDEPDPQ